MHHRRADLPSRPRGITRPGLPVLLLFLGIVHIGTVHAAERKPVPADRWLELDLYWFDPNRVDASAEAFWKRYAPLYRDVAGYRGVVLNIGLTVNYIMEFNGDLNQRITLPKGAGQELGAKIEGALPGDTAQRQRLWRERFRHHDNKAAQVSYGKWSYAQLKQLANALRRKGAQRGITEFRVATFVVASRNAYGEVGPFALAHPEAWTRWGPARDLLDTSAYFDPNARLKGDQTRYAAMPGGIVEGMSVHAAFGAQWGALSRAVGLDAIMLRDGFGFPRAYTRYGPHGETLPNAETAQRMTDGVSQMLKSMKKGNPRALIMMWSTAATATSDWRANGLDLERIAREGNLDIFVDQTWAGAWNEVGVRQQTFWNAAILGWTYQLGYLLQHRAVLAGSKVRHYFLTETFDAWESWDTIHTVPDRLRWAIWAYSHAAVKTPQGIDMPEGSYISWGNRGIDLLSEGDVAFLSSNLNAAARDAAEVTDVPGPTIVYAREAMQQQVENLTLGFDARDRIDEQVGSIVKWGVPILSATRLEWLPKVKSDLFVFGATARIPQAQRDAIQQRVRDGQPIALFGAVGPGTDPSLAKLAGVVSATHEPPQQDRNMRASRGDAALGLLGNVPAAFDAPPTPRRNIAAPGTTVYGFGDSAALTLNRHGGTNVALWDPPSLTDYWYRPLRDLMNGDPSPYVLAAATLSRQLEISGAPGTASIDGQQTGTVSLWRKRDGVVMILAGNLEEGLRDDTDHRRTISFRVPDDVRAPLCNLSGQWGTARRKESGVLNIELNGQSSILIELRRDRCSIYELVGSNEHVVHQ